MRLGSALQDPPLSPLRSNIAGLVGTAPLRPSPQEEWEAHEFVARLPKTTNIPSVEHSTPKDADTSSWIRQHNAELTLAITVLALVVAVLAWLFPRSTPTPAQVKVVWIIVGSSLGTHGAVAPGHFPASHMPSSQPAKVHGSR
jgi:hypothetical protein